MEKGINLKRKIVLIVLMSLILMVMLAGCIPGDGKHNEENKAGFSGEYGTAGLRQYL